MKNVRRNPRFVGSAALAFVAVAGLAAAARPHFTVKGVTYRVKVETRMPNFGPGGGNPGGDPGAGGGGGFGGFGGGAVQLVRVELAGNRAKVEFQVGNLPGSSITDYYVMLLDSNKTYRVSPDAQTYADASLAPNGAGRAGRGGGPPRGAGGGAAGAGGAGGGRGNRGGNTGADNPGGRGGRGGGGINPMQLLTDMVVTDVKTNVEDLGAGELIDARPTKHYKITVNYGFKLYGQPREGKTTTEVWTVDFAQRVVNPFEATTAVGDSGTMADVTRRLIQEAKKLPGVPVKVVTTQVIPVSAIGADSVEVSAAGAIAQTVSIVRTTAITALKEAEVDEADFVIPAEFKKTSGFGRGGQ